ncbi:MAG: hypothetical protein KAR84_04630, partial [Elusimicrobiales bacterium]|nr:hypothetical protein [Elusimicrobiales bacterium]
LLSLERIRMEKIYTEKERDLDERLNSKDEEIVRLKEDLTNAKHDKEITLVQLTKEREELLLLERVRIEGVFTKKKKDLEEMLLARKEEVALLRDDALHAKHNKEIVLTQVSKEKEELKGKISELADKYNQSETEHHVKLENVIKREAEKFHNVLDKKESEMEALKLLKENQEESYRKSLENFRTKLSDAVGKLETIKHVADDRQNQIASLYMEMTEAKKNYDQELMSSNSKSDDYSRQLKEVKGEYEEQKNNFDTYSDENNKRMNDVMLKLRKTEERFKGLMDKFDEAKREIELRKIEADKKNDNIRQLESEVENQKDESLKVMEEFRRRDKSHKGALENLQAEISQRESTIAQLNNSVKDKSVLVAEMNALREKFVSKEMAIEKLNSEIKSLVEKSMMYKNDLTISRSKIKEVESIYSKAAGENERLANDIEVIATKYNRAKYMYESEKKKKEEVDVLAQTSSSALREKEDEFKKLMFSFNQAQRDYNRVKNMCENERKKKEELDVLAQTSSSALREKAEENQNLSRTFERIKEDLSLNVKLMKEKDEAIEYLTEEMSKLHKLKKEYMKGRKVIDQLKERINSWKKS